MQGDDLTDAEKDRVLRVGVYFDDGDGPQAEDLQEFWCGEIPEVETRWYQHHDPPAYDPVRNRIATIQQLAPDDVVVLFGNGRPEAGCPADRGYHLRPVSGRWRIASTVNYREAVCQSGPQQARPFDWQTGAAAYYWPDAAAIARARRMLETLQVDPLVQAMEENAGDLFAA